jgi:hypothetical protein
MDSQGALVHEMLGKFIDEAVNKAVTERLNVLMAETERRVREVSDKNTASLNESMEKASERIFASTCQRLMEAIGKAMEDLPVTIQETMMQMSQETETMFRRRAEEWMQQLQADNTASAGEAIQAQFEALRKKTLQETTESARAICDRNIFDFRSEFENHVNRTFVGVAERLTAPWPTESAAIVPVVRH